MALKFAKQVVDEYRRDDCPMMAAGLAFYAVFSIPPLLFVLVNSADTLLGNGLAEQGLIDQTGRLLGPDAAAQFAAMLKNAAARRSGEGAAVLISLAALLFAATGAFVQLQSALNRVWGVHPNADRPFVIAYLARRVASVGMMAFLGIFLLASLGLSTLFGADAALPAWQLETGPPQLEAVAVPDDPEDFDCAWGTEERLALLEKLNRCDRGRLPKLDKIVIPLDWDRDEADYSPLPKKLAWAENLNTVVLVHAPMQAFAAYEYGELVHWGPISSGGRNSPTPLGAYFLNWKSKGRHSTVNHSWFLRWYFNFENSRRHSFHEYALPGLPESHGCVRLLARDAKWMYDWGSSWKLDKTGRDLEAFGTPVIIIGEYDFDSPPPWKDPELVEQGFRLSRSGHWAARATESLAAERLHDAGMLLNESDD